MKSSADREQEEKPYGLVVCTGSHRSTPLLQVSSDHPFPAFHVGDLIERYGWMDNDPSPNYYLTVLSVLHRIVPSEDGIAKHQVCLLTEIGPACD